MELHLKYRPRKLDDVVGQEIVVKSIRKGIKNDSFPHAVMLTGSEGNGKTTLARICSKLIGCHKSDYKEMDTADMRGIDTIRGIKDRMYLHPFGGGRSKVYCFDEVHQATKDAQNAMLKILEGGAPDNVYFFLCTTDPTKLLKTIRSRCVEWRMIPLKVDAMTSLIQRTVKAEDRKISKEVTERIVEVAEGLPRKALVILGQVLALDDEEEQLAAVLSNDSKNQAIELARAVMFNPNWKKVSSLLRSLDESPETIRRLIMAYASSVLLGGGSNGKRAAFVMNAFLDPYFDCENARLRLSCFEAVHGTGQ